MGFADVALLGWTGAVLAGVLGVCTLVAAIVLAIVGCLLDD